MSRSALAMRVDVRAVALIEPATTGLQSWLPDTERSEIPDVTHLLVAQRADVIAGRLEAFWQRISS